MPAFNEIGTLLIVVGAIRIENVRTGDLPAITAIYNDVIATSTAVYSESEVTLLDREMWWADRIASGFPVLVAREDGECLGYSTFGTFRSWPCYQHTVEHSVHVRTDVRGNGIGRLLVEHLFPKAQAMGKHVMVAGIDAENQPSLRLHRRLGFADVGDVLRSRTQV